MSRRRLFNPLVTAQTRLLEQLHLSLKGAQFRLKMGSPALLMILLLRAGTTEAGAASCADSRRLAPAFGGRKTALSSKVRKTLKMCQKFRLKVLLILAPEKRLPEYSGRERRVNGTEESQLPKSERRTLHEILCKPL